MHGGGRAGQHFDTVNAEQRRRDFPVVMSALCVVQSHAVDEDECLAKRRSAHAEVGLHVTAAARARVDPRQQPEALNHR